MLKTAEAVSLGHPDKTADYISSALLDILVAQDPWVKYAVEVMVKDNAVIFAGEVSGAIKLPDLKEVAQKALGEIGYTQEYYARWRENVVNPNALQVMNLIGAQSLGINQGVAQDGWGDQGVFVGYACKGEKTLPQELYLARKLNAALYEKALKSAYLGIDIKTQITLDEQGHITTAIAAVPMLEKADLTDFIIQVLGQRPTEIIVNGTGRYESHGAVADCGVTGRKLACDFYSTECAVGGGSPWGKDATKADVTLNHYARQLARENLCAADECFVYLSSCIGQAKLPSATLKSVQDGRIMWRDLEIETRPSRLIAQMGLDKPVYRKLCRESVGL